MNHISKFSLLGIAGAVAISGYTAEQKQPNLLLILSDDHSVPDLGCFGNPDLKTPNLDKLAAEGLRATRMYTTSPQCAPSRGAIMTGRSTIDIGMSRFSAPLPADVPIFPERLREAGYFTGLLGRTHHLDGTIGDGKYAHMAPETEAAYKKHGFKAIDSRVDRVIPGHAVQASKKFFDDLPAGKPFFAQICFHDPHRTTSDPKTFPEPASLTMKENIPDTPLLRKELALHYGKLERLDRDFGFLMQELRGRGLLENTFIVFMGDNGSSLIKGKGTLYQRGLNVPLIAWWPGKIRAGRMVDCLLSGEDIAPTFLDVAGLSPYQEMTGRSFLPLLKEEPYTKRTAVFAVRGPHGYDLPHNTGAFDLIRCVITERYSLIYNCLASMPYYPVDVGYRPAWKDAVERYQAGEFDSRYTPLFKVPRPMFELYDLECDPQEFNNIYWNPENKDLQRKMRGNLLEWMVINQDYLPLPIGSNE